LAALFLAVCSVSEPKSDDEPANAETLTLMTWNLQNLFDGNDNGTEYEEYRESAGWTTEKYLGRINAITAAIDKLEPRPDIIMVQEVESLKILEDLAGAITDHVWTHFANNPGAALGLGIVSGFPLIETRVHSISVNGDATPRPVLEARVQAKEEVFIIFVCHWKSKLGDDEVTENVRKASVRVILRRMRELWKEEPQLGIIIAGDLNENHDEFFRQNAKGISALLPDDPYCALLTGCYDEDGAMNADKQKDFFILSKSKPPEAVHFPKESIVLYSPWTKDLENGSYYYKHNWETIDHFLLTSQFFTNSGWDFEKAEVLNFQPFASSGGLPVPYNLRTGAGLSDHLPLLLTLKMKVSEKMP
jgi:endonuclease/exonuclease/phosphatase family metal-dependent hydrolase